MFVRLLDLAGTFNGKNNKIVCNWSLRHCACNNKMFWASSVITAACDRVLGFPVSGREFFLLLLYFVSCVSNIPSLTAICSPIWSISKCRWKEISIKAFVSNSTVGFDWLWCHRHGWCIRSKQSQWNIVCHKSIMKMLKGTCCKSSVTKPHPTFSLVETTTKHERLLKFIHFY